MGRVTVGAINSNAVLEPIASKSSTIQNAAGLNLFSSDFYIGGRFLLRLHLLEKQPLSEVCEQYGIAPTQFYQWQKLFFENGAAAFEPKKAGREYDLEKKVKQLGKKLVKKDDLRAGPKRFLPPEKPNSMRHVRHVKP